MQNSGVSETATTERKLAFGAYPVVSLTLARKLRDDSHAEQAQGNDPGQTRLHEKQAKKVGKTLEEVARAWHKTNRTRSNVHSTRILRSLEMYLFPSLGKQSLPISPRLSFCMPSRPSKTKDFLAAAAAFCQYHALCHTEPDD
ncbi:TPA: integrase arm-type DNA-binding domain-containing protein [Serratia fonticola]